MSTPYKLNEKIDTVYKKLNSRICKLEANAGSGNGYAYIANNYNDLLVQATNPQVNEFAYLKASQGTPWDPWNVFGGTYYPSGTWFYTGTEWTNDKSQIAAQLQININDIIDIENELLALTTTVGNQGTAITTLDGELGDLDLVVNNHITDLNNPHQTQTGTPEDLITDVIVDDSIDFIYRGFNRNGAWEIERFNIGDVNIKLLATEANNPIYLDLTNAWNNRGVLTYA